MDWFETLTGFAEESPEQVRKQLQLTGTTLTSLVNGREMEVGHFLTPTLAELRQRTPKLPSGSLQLREVVGDVMQLHADPVNQHAVFQVASQFNCLEMVFPDVIPEEGVGIYENDRTQGPACSISAGAGTIYRNYLVPVGDTTGQSADRQIDGLAKLHAKMQEVTKHPWQMKNGYCLPSAISMEKIRSYLAECDEKELDQLRQLLMVGVQEGTEVTLAGAGHRVTQVFCSALPIAYSSIPVSDWGRFPKLILDATYEATFRVAIENLQRHQVGKLFLTLVGGGVFGNSIAEILGAIERSLALFREYPLEVAIVSYGSSQSRVADFVQRQQSQKC